jgi:hypothetical protein
MPMVVLGIDAHERTHTVVAVDEVGRQLGVRVTKSTSTAAPAAGGVGGPVRAGAPVGGRGLPASVAAAGAGLGGGRGGEIARVPPKLMAHVRDSARTYGRSDPIDALAPSLLALPGVADLTAAKIVAETAGADRFASKDAFARHNGTAPLPVRGSPQTVDTLI